MTELIKRSTVEQLLGRKLGRSEFDNFNLYLSIAVERLQDLLCLEELMIEDHPSLLLLLARCFAVISEEQEASARSGVSQKKVEDFSISYDTGVDTPMAAFIRANQETIAKYSECQGKIISGEVRRGECLRCI